MGPRELVLQDFERLKAQYKKCAPLGRDSDLHIKESAILYAMYTKTAEQVAVHNVFCPGWDDLYAKIVPCIRRTIPVMEAVQTFYTLEIMKVLLMDSKKSGFDEFRHSHARWYADFMEYCTEFTQKFAAAIYDYTTTVVAGEMRHGKNCCNMRILDMPCGGGRAEMYGKCTRWTAHSVLSAGAELYNPENTKWSGAYGGAKWYMIAKAGLMYKKVPDAVFIDHCVDLSHNCSVYFDKGAGMFRMNCTSSDYKLFLDTKRTADMLTVLDDVHSLGPVLTMLLTRGVNLGLFPAAVAEGMCAPTEEAQQMEHAVLRYLPVFWGSETLAPVLVSSHDSSQNCSYNSSDDDEDEGEDDGDDDSSDDDKPAKLETFELYLEGRRAEYENDFDDIERLFDLPDDIDL